MEFSGICFMLNKKKLKFRITIKKIKKKIINTNSKKNQY